MCVISLFYYNIYTCKIPYKNFSTISEPQIKYRTTLKTENFCRLKYVGKGKGKAIPLQSLDRPRVFREVEAPRFQDNRLMKLVRLSALRTIGNRARDLPACSAVPQPTAQLRAPIFFNVHPNSTCTFISG
jgi:hypothetical protein